VLHNFVTAADRYIFKRSIVGSDEIQIYVMVWMTFVGAAVVTWRRQHLRMDVLASRFPRPVRVVLLWIELVLVVVLMIVLMSQSSRYAAVMQAIDRRSDLANLPMWIPHMALAIGFGLIALITLWRIIELLAGRTVLPDEHAPERI
jgi:TRAP-type C4-dicarboxylate transport system permease small subunit